jgi:uncharacterized protein YjiS (DUF1127 family)
LNEGASSSFQPLAGDDRRFSGGAAASFKRGRSRARISAGSHQTEVIVFPTLLAKAFATYRRRRQLTLELGRLSDHQLNDIGITRHDLFAPERSTIGDRHDHQ